MKFSNYNHVFFYQGQTFLYNLLSTAIVQLDEKTKLAIEENEIDALENLMINEMETLGFVVEDDLDESLVYQYFCNNIKYAQTLQNLSITLVPTYNCNLACPYCIQGAKKEVFKISRENLDSILKFIENSIENSRDTIPIRKLSISLFGGEPLVCKPELLYFCENAKKISEGKDIEIVFDMTSNLTLLDDQIIDMIKEYQIAIQVSIDGIKPQHDIRRIQKNGAGTYDTIIRNLARLVDEGLKDLITIRLNIDGENISNAEEMFLAVKPYSNDIYFGFLTSLKGVNENYKEKCIGCDCFCETATGKLNDIVEKNGYVVPQSFGRKAPCAMSCQNKIFIDCNMNVYKCELLLNHAECKVGHIEANGTFVKNSGYYNQMAFSPFDFEECRKCKFLPVCGGGCPATIYVDSNKKDGKICEKNCSFNEEILNSYLCDYVGRLLKN